MTSNLLSLNSSKTEFLLIGLKRQLSKIHNSLTSIDTILNLLETLASYLTNIFLFLIRYLHCLNPAIITFVLSAVSVPTLTFTPQKQLPPPLYTPSLTTVTLCTIWSSEISNKSSQTHPECSCSNWRPGSKIQTHHSYSEISSLA